MFCIVAVANLLYETKVELPKCELAASCVPSDSGTRVGSEKKKKEAHLLEHENFSGLFSPFRKRHCLACTYVSYLFHTSEVGMHQQPSLEPDVSHSPAIHI